jgi:Flp pilus assembly protein TadG
MQLRRFKGDQGAVTTEFVIVTPVLLFFLMLVVQAGLYYHAVSVASAAAQEGARVAAMEGQANPIAAGEAEASDFVNALAPTLLINVGAEGQMVDGGDVVRITVTGDVLQVFEFPGINLDFSVQETSESVIEEFRPATEAPPADT